MQRIRMMMERSSGFCCVSALWIILMASVLCEDSTPFKGHGAGGNVQRFFPDPWPTEQGLMRTAGPPGEACSDTDCRNGGICLFTQGRNQCSCRPGLTGHFCEDLDLDLNCDNDHMRIRILRSALSDMGIPEDLLLSSPECKVETSDLYVSVTLTHVNHTLCGTHLYVNESHLIYSNELRTEQSLETWQQIPGRLISRTFDVSIRFSCVYHYDHIVSLPYPLLTSASLVTFVVKEGKVNVTMTLHPTAAFSRLFDWIPNIPLSQRLYVQVRLHGHELQNQLRLELEECWATPGINHSDQIRHVLLSKGNGNDFTVEMIPTMDYSLSRFSLKMFHFVSYPEFYLHCRVWLCQINTTGCEKPFVEKRLQRRDLHDPYRKVISCGPIRLFRSMVSSVGKLESGFNPLILPASLAAAATLLVVCLVAAAKALKRIRVRRRLDAPQPK
uniref:Uncharacterized protein n=1 Tax=Leptobrachium leishanense TaxID=445787 RepID=A0A8C5QQC5_9ANUR